MSLEGIYNTYLNDYITQLLLDSKTLGMICLLFIRITCPCKVYLLTPHFYIVKRGFTGVYIFSYFCS